MMRKLLRNVLLLVVVAIGCLALKAQGNETMNLDTRDSQPSQTTSSFHAKEAAPKIQPNLEFYAKVGANIMSADWNGFCWWEDPDGKISGKSRFGVDLTFGLMSHFCPSIPSNFYWGGELSLTQVGGGFKEFTCTEIWGKSTYIDIYPKTSFANWGLALSPTIGWDREVAKNKILDLHFNLGVFCKFKRSFIECYEVHYDSYSDKYDYDYDYDDVEESSFRVFFKVGAGLWLGKFNIDLSYRYLTLFDEYNLNYSNFIVSFGYKF